jgi:spermidine/putrescine-binding protein
MKQLTRQEFLVRTGALGLLASTGGVLSACGGDNGGTGDDALEGELNVIAWAQEWEFAVKPFEQETGVTVNMTFQDDPLATMAKIKEGPGDIDVVSFGPFDTPFVSEGLIQELDLSRLEHWEDLPETLRQFLLEGFDGSVYMVPYYWGSTLMARNVEVVPEEVRSWAALWDPQHKGKVALLDQAFEAFARMAFYNGRDLNDYSEAAFEENAAAARKLIPNLRTYWSTGTDIQQLLARGEVGLTDIWDGTARTLAATKRPVEIVVPEEGVRGWIDGPGIVVGAPHPNAAYAWINYVSRPEVGAELATEFSFTPANPNSFELLDEATADVIQADQAEALLTSPLFRLAKVDAETSKQISDWWEKVKIEAG